MVCSLSFQFQVLHKKTVQRYVPCFKRQKKNSCKEIGKIIHNSVKQQINYSTFSTKKNVKLHTLGTSTSNNQHSSPMFGGTSAVWRANSSPASCPRGAEAASSTGAKKIMSRPQTESGNERKGWWLTSNGGWRWNLNMIYDDFSSSESRLQRESPWL